MVKLISDVDFEEITSEEKFLIDTNVLLAVHFGSSLWSAEKIEQYANFILALLKNGNELYVSALNLQELCHSFENNEFSQYKKVNGKGREFTKKMYRAIEEERTRLAKDLQSKHSEISDQYIVISGNITNDMIKDFIEDYENHFYDPIDFVTVRYNADGITNVITADADFKKDSRITVYAYD